MTFNFPNTPTLGQTFAPADGPLYVWDGSAWRAIGPGAPATVRVSDTPPANPVAGQLWWESDTGKLFIWYVDIDSSAWVHIFSGPKGERGPAGEGIYDTTAAMPTIAVPGDVSAIRTNGYASPGDGGGALYRRVVSEPAHAGKVQSMDGAWWEYSPEGEINGAAFGLDMTGATFSDTAWQNLLNYAKEPRTDPYGPNPGWGQNTIRLPKGKIKLQNSWDASASVIGYAIEGLGKFVTSIEFHNDLDPLFNMTINIAFSMRRLSIAHVPINVDRTTWTNSVLKRTGNGGGNEFHLDEVWTKNFAYIDHNISTVNNDTTRFTYCRFVDARRVIYSRSPQSLVNKLDFCSVTGKTEKMLDIAGTGHTLCDTCNIVIDGTWLHLENVASAYGQTAVYTFKNCKGEPYNTAALPAGSVSQLITYSSNGSFVTADVHFEQCGFSSALLMDPAVYQLDICTGIRVRCDGGGMNAVKLRCNTLTIASATALRNQRNVLFENMRSPPSPAFVSLPAGVSGAGNTSVTWRNCVGFPDLTIGTQYGDGRTSRSVMRLQSGAGGTLIGGTTINHDLPFYGFQQRVVEIMVHLNSKAGGNFTCDVYSDAARTVSLGQILITSADNSATPIVRRLAAAVDKFVTEGLYFSLAHTVSGQLGYLLVTYEATG